MGGKVKGRRFLIVLSREEERIVKAAADASGEPRATFIRRAAVAQAFESALAIDDEIHHKVSAEQLSDEEVWLHNLAGTYLRFHPKWVQYLRMYKAPQVPTADMPQVPPWTQPAVTQRKWAAGREMTLQLPAEKPRRQARK